MLFAQPPEAEYISQDFPSSDQYGCVCPSIPNLYEFL